MYVNIGMCVYMCVFLYTDACKCYIPACRGSLFRGLRNLDHEVVYDTLERVKRGEILITALNNECRRIKKMIVLKKAFCKGVGVESWDEAVEAFPSFATIEGVEKFLHIEPESAQFQQYCMKAARLVNHIIYLCDK